MNQQNTELKTSKKQIKPSLHGIGKVFIHFPLFTTMSNLLDHYRNILAGYKNAVVDDVKEKLFGEEQSSGSTNNNQFDPLKEDYFGSHNNKGLPRYYQTLYYSKTAYGMECNPCVVMYCQ